MKNNKGFSLVELIIVIAIMAVLVGVLAPTYLQYVEKSKKSNDVQTVDSIVNALEICAIDPEVQVAGDWNLKITVDTTGIKIYDSEGAAEVATEYATKDNMDTRMESALFAIVGDSKLKSTKWNTSDNKLVILASPVADGYGKVTIKMVKSVGGNSEFEAFSKHAKITFS